MWFDFARIEGLPTQYAEAHYPVTADVLEAGFITAYVILLISFLIVRPNSNKVEALWSTLRITVSLTIGLFIMLGNFGQEWEVDHIESKTPYKAGVTHHINASIGVKIGLRSVNVTLKNEGQLGPEMKDETIDYNERFYWSDPWDQGRFGFGPFAGELQQEFRAAQNKGLPTPILWIVDYFVIDGEGFRFGRFYRTAGWYAHILMWTSFATWLLANILFKSVIEYGAYFLSATGLLQLAANLIWLVVRDPNNLVIPFEDAELRPRFGFSYWLTFFTGIVCTVLGVVLIIIDQYTDWPLHTVFGVDSLNNYSLLYVTNEEKNFLGSFKKGSMDKTLSVEDAQELVTMRPMRRHGPHLLQQMRVRNTMLNRDLKQMMKFQRESTIYENVNSSFQMEA